VADVLDDDTANQPTQHLQQFIITAQLAANALQNG
jgi:hypothetical protein